MLHWLLESDAHRLPVTASVCEMVILLHPTSAPAERVLSLLSNNLHKHQHGKLEDIRELHIMQKYNERALTSRGGHD